MIYLIIFVGVPALLILHEVLINWIPYRWLFNSIIFPLNYFRLRKRIRNMEDKAVELAFFLEDKHWFDSFWFGKRIKNMWIKEVSKIN